jgi:hypothetical protein
VPGTSAGFPFNLTAYAQSSLQGPTANTQTVSRPGPFPLPGAAAGSTMYTKHGQQVSQQQQQQLSLGIGSMLMPGSALTAARIGVSGAAATAAAATGYLPHVPTQTNQPPAPLLMSSQALQLAVAQAQQMFGSSGRPFLLLKCDRGPAALRHFICINKGDKPLHQLHMNTSQMLGVTPQGGLRAAVPVCELLQAWFDADAGRKWKKHFVVLEVSGVALLHKPSLEVWCKERAAAAAAAAYCG